MDTSKYKKIYLEEAHSHLGGIESGLLSLDSGIDPDSTITIIDNLFRHYHTMKGMSASMGYEDPKRLAHVLEDLLSKLRSKELRLTEEIIETQLKGLDALKEMVAVIEDDSGRSIECGDLITVIEAACKGGERPADTQAAQQEKDAGNKTVPVAKIQKPEKPQPARTTSSREISIKPLRLSNTMKVDSRVFDELQTTVGDLYMELSSFKTISGTPGTIAFKDSVFSLGKTLNRLHASILTARMLPIANLTETLPRVVYDLAKKSGKEISLIVETGDISLDRSILENLGGPLLHIIRNSVDHAIELPEEREALNKKRQASIKIKAFPVREHVVVEISDDGRGINIEAIKKKALNSGYTSVELEAMDRNQLLKLVCLPGLSTAASITDTSGRGVGMDVVKENIESIGGRLSITSTDGVGTTISMDLPRSTSIIKALFVSVFNELFLLPISSVAKVIEATAEEANSKSLTIDELEIPLVPLAPALGLNKESTATKAIDKETKQEHYAIVIVDITQTAYHGPALAEGPHALVGIVVDDFGLEIDAFVKPLPAPITTLRGVSGITVTGDGRPVFLIDIAAVTAGALKVT